MTWREVPVGSVGVWHGMRFRRTAAGTVPSGLDGRPMVSVVYVDRVYEGGEEVASPGEAGLIDADALALGAAA